MKQIIILLVILNCTGLFAQDINKLQQINSKAKAQFIKPESLDGLRKELREYDQSHDSLITHLLFDTYKTISAAYMAENHFRQAYEVYNKYLWLKEAALLREKDKSIQNTITEISTKRSGDETEQKRLLYQLSSLKKENGLMADKKLSFKRNFSFALILLTSVFAVLLVSSGIKMVNLRSKLRQARERMKNIHRTAITGNLETGLRHNFVTSLDRIEMKTKDLSLDLKKHQNMAPARESGQIISGIEKIIKDLKSKFNF